MLAEVFDLMGTIVLVPFEIAIYRLLILGEAASGYRFDISAVRFQRMLGWTAGFWLLGNIPLYLPGAVAPSDGAEVIISVGLFALVIFAGCDWRFSWPPSREARRALRSETFSRIPAATPGLSSRRTSLLCCPSS
jgi:hypothetical protein